MSRLFIGPREINFISDITKEVIKDVIGAVIYYYPISENKTKVHGIYGESTEKVFDAPIKIDVIADSQYQTDTHIDQFGVDADYNLSVFVQYRDVIEKGINICIGDFFSFSDIFYEITGKEVLKNIYGLPEYRGGIKITGAKARESLFKAKLHGPTDITHPEPDAIQQRFVQQRGMPENKDGRTGDVHDLVKNGTLDPPLTGQREVSPLGDPTNTGSSFYDEE